MDNTLQIGSRVHITHRINTSKDEDTNGRVVRIDDPLVYVELDNGQTVSFLRRVVQVQPQ